MTTIGKLAAGGFVVAVVVAYLAGYWPEQNRRIAAEADAARSHAELATAEQQVRLGALLGQALRLSEAVEQRNYSDAQAVSTAFFNEVRGELAQTSRDDVKKAMQQLLDVRDLVTKGIAMSDPALADVLRTVERALRQVLGYPVG